MLATTWPDSPDGYASQLWLFGRCASQAAKAAFLKEAFGLSLATTASTVVAWLVIWPHCGGQPHHPKELVMPKAQSQQSLEPLSESSLYQFTGDILRYTHPLNRKVIYTPGVRYLADAGRAYWLIDAITSYFGSPEMNAAIAKDPRIGQMQFWRLEVSDEKAVLTAEADAGEVPFIRQEIVFTDFPLKQVDIWAGFDGIYWTLYLPSEH